MAGERLWVVVGIIILRIQLTPVTICLSSFPLVHVLGFGFPETQRTANRRITALPMCMLNVDCCWMCWDIFYGRKLELHGVEAGWSWEIFGYRWRVTRSSKCVISSWVVGRLYWRHFQNLNLERRLTQGPYSKEVFINIREILKDPTSKSLYWTIFYNDILPLWKKRAPWKKRASNHIASFRVYWVPTRIIIKASGRPLFAKFSRKRAPARFFHPGSIDIHHQTKVCRRTKRPFQEFGPYTRTNENITTSYRHLSTTTKQTPSKINLQYCQLVILL